MLLVCRGQTVDELLEYGAWVGVFNSCLVQMAVQVCQNYSIKFFILWN